MAVLGEDGEKAQCRVLDCDTVTQVKAKILDALYRNTPQSLRPSVHQVDLGKSAVVFTSLFTFSSSFLSVFIGKYRFKQIISDTMVAFEPLLN